MKKIIMSFVCLLLVSVIAYADQTLNGRQTREWAQAVSSVKAGTNLDYSGNATVFSNVVSSGNQATGNPGYFVLTAVDKAGNVITYYLWMDATMSAQGSRGTLRFASFPLLTSNPTVYTSFPYGDWRFNTGFTSGVSVTTSQLTS